PPFKPAEVIAGIKTRRLDRLSGWALVAAGLALQDAGLEPGRFDPDRAGVTFGTAFGCLELTEAFMRSVAENGHTKADPILFPETLGNQPASHVARHYGLKGPNITLSRGLMSGEAALLEAKGLLESGEASVVVTMAGDALTRGLFEWYEAAGLLAPECYGESAADGRTTGRLLPGEGLGAMVLETAEHFYGRGAVAQADLLAVISEGPASGGAGDVAGWAGVIRRALIPYGGSDALTVIVEGPGVGFAVEALVAGTISPTRPMELRPEFDTGAFGGSGIMAVAAALGATATAAAPGTALVLGCDRGERATVVLGLQAKR
ncbi:MAG: hypothetical protein EHM24_32955, partial [Acidobacteria bacterium]